jgi:hypothetical protein
VVLAAACRGIAGVPDGSSLDDIDEPPPMCDCGLLEAQGASVVGACLDAYLSLEDLGDPNPSAPFGSKEEVLASGCVCPSSVAGLDDLRACFADLLASTTPDQDPPRGALGTACADPGACGSFACCGDGSPSPEGGCCDACVPCGAFVDPLSGGDPSPGLCFEDEPVYAELAVCLCDEAGKFGLLEARCVQECGGVGAIECSPATPACVRCVAEDDGVLSVCIAKFEACEQSLTPARPVR